MSSPTAAAVDIAADVRAGRRKARDVVEVQARKLRHMGDVVPRDPLRHNAMVGGTAGHTLLAAVVYRR